MPGVRKHGHYKYFYNALISHLEALAANGRQLILANSGFSSSNTWVLHELRSIIFSHSQVHPLFQVSLASLKSIRSTNWACARAQRQCWDGRRLLLSDTAQAGVLPALGLGPACPPLSGDPGFPTQPLSQEIPEVSVPLSSLPQVGEGCCPS